MTITQTLPTSSVKQTLETCGGQVFELTPIPLPKIDLRDAHAIRRELGAVYRDVRAGRVQTQHGTRLAYVLDMIGKAYQSAVLQERIDHLERTLDYRRGQP